MADALSEALQKLSVAHSRTQLRSDYQSVAPHDGKIASDVACTSQSATIESQTASAEPVAATPAVTRFAAVAPCTQNPVTLEESASRGTIMASVAAVVAPPADTVPEVTMTCLVNESTAVPESHTQTPGDSPVSPVDSSSSPRLLSPPAPSADAEPDATPVPKPVQAAATTPIWKRPIAMVLEHRRHAAAVVVVICMAMFWFDDPTSSSTNGDSAETLAEDFSDVEAALSEFDVRSAPELKEPAEPIDVSTDYNLTIPTHDTLSQSSDSGANASETTATYPDSYGGLELPPSNGFGAANGATTEEQPSGFSVAPVSAPAGSGRSVKARLSHSIQPIN